jgi:hypothetical protein
VVTSVSEPVVVAVKEDFTKSVKNSAAKRSSVVMCTSSLFYQTSMIQSMKGNLFIFVNVISIILY